MATFHCKIMRTERESFRGGWIAREAGSYKEAGTLVAKEFFREEPTKRDTIFVAVADETVRRDHNGVPIAVIILEAKTGVTVGEAAEVWPEEYEENKVKP